MTDHPRPPSQGGGGELVDLGDYRKATRMALVCISCLWRWEASIPSTMPLRALYCPHPQCAAQGTIVKN